MTALDGKAGDAGSASSAGSGGEIQGTGGESVGDVEYERWKSAHPRVSALADLRFQAASSSPSGTSGDGTSTNNPSSSNSSSGSNNGWSQGVIAGVVVAAVAIVVAIIVAWWKPHQCLWLISCGTCGHYHAVKPPSYSQNEIQLSHMGPSHPYQPAQPPQNFHFNFNNSNNHLQNGGYGNQNGYEQMGPIYR